ncbi:MAG: hypothetical protein ACK5LS_06685 [Propioniciclava sp.]
MTLTSSAPHPLDALSADEIRVARDLLGDHGLLGDGGRVAYLGLKEPAKHAVRAALAGEGPAPAR